MSKRPITSFFTPLPSKKPRISLSSEVPPSMHFSYPFPIPCLPAELELASRKKNDEGNNEEIEPVSMNDKEDLDMLYYQPFLNGPIAKELFLFLRKELPFYRVEYKINRGGDVTNVKTPRFTTIFGVDESSYFPPNSGELLDTKSKHPIPKDRYHSDDEKFWGENPVIASLSLGSRRDFLMKHKSIPNLSLKLALSSGDLVLMQNATQVKWLHPVPKRSSTVTAGDSATSWAGGGRINITFRKVVSREGMENYYCYNVGNGPIYKWDEVSEKMVL